VAATEPIRAAGAVVWRRQNGLEVLLIHRPQYDDWTFPKGKLDDDEVAPEAAVREVREESGLRVTLGSPLPDQHYTMGRGAQARRKKVVQYWAARAVGGHDVGDFKPNDEVDVVRWVRLVKARRQLSYPRDVELLDDFEVLDRRTTPLLVVRHAEARRRKSWRGEESERPLTAAGSRQSSRLASLLRAYGVGRVTTSDAARCVDTMLPFVNATKAEIALRPELSEEAFDPAAVGRRVHRVLQNRRRTALCSHRPVLPTVFDALGVEHVHLKPGEVAVVHHRRGTVHAFERHLVR